VKLEVLRATCSTYTRLGALPNRQQTNSSRTDNAQGGIKLDYMYQDKCDSSSTGYLEAGFYNSYKNLPVTYLFGKGRLLQARALEHSNRNDLKEAVS
jgi:hypothetical protein